MSRVFLTADEKEAARQVLHHTWKPADLTQAAITRASAPFGVSARDAYMTLLHLDTIDALSGLGFLVFKGGTCVQTHLKPGHQRISVDLDYNSRHPHPNTLQTAIADLNVDLARKGRTAKLRNLDFGSFHPREYDAQSGTIEFARYMPTPFDEQAVREGVEFQARLLRVQINVKHHEMPALDPERAAVKFFTQPVLTPSHTIRTERASAADLTADKILTITKNVGGFGRERIKDFYDLFALRRLDVPRTRVQEKLDRIAARVGVSRESLLNGAIERCEEVRANYTQARGFVTSVCSEGKTLLGAWEMELGALQEQIQGLR